MTGIRVGHRARWTPLAFALAAAIVVVAGGSLPAYARSLDAKETAALTETVDAFNAAMSTQNFERVVQTIPPKVLVSLGAKANVTPDQIREMVITLMKTALATVKIESFGMDMKAVQFKELASGAPYALIPTVTVMDVGDKGRFQQKSHTLGLLDEGKWYLVRVSEVAQLMILREVYPEFAGVEFPQGSMEVLKK
jgi:hypothetical protein